MARLANPSSSPTTVPPTATATTRDKRVVPLRPGSVTAITRSRSVISALTSLGADYGLRELMGGLYSLAFVGHLTSAHAASPFRTWLAD